MNVLHISDIHFRESYLPCEEGYQGMLAAMQNPLIPLEECIQDAKARVAIDLVVISGDLTEDGAPADYASLKRYLEKAFGSVPIVVTLGNHDIKRHFRQGWQGKSVETASDTPFNQVYETETLAIVTFDNSCYGYANGIVDERQFEWLQATLAQLKEKKIVFVTHHHLLPDQASTPAWAGANRLVALLQQYLFSVDIPIMRLRERSQGFLTILWQVCRLSGKMKAMGWSVLKNAMDTICIVLRKVHWFINPQKTIDQTVY